MNEEIKTTFWKFIFALSCFLLLGSLTVQGYTSNATALKGKDFIELYERKSELEKELAYLKFEDSNLSTLTYVEHKAAELGFVEMSEPLLTIVPPSLASR